MTNQDSAKTDKSRTQEEVEDEEFNQEIQRMFMQRDLNAAYSGMDKNVKAPERCSRSSNTANSIATTTTELAPSTQAPSSQSASAHDAHPYCGLENSQYVCYSNSVLQCLYTLSRIRQYFLSHVHSGPFHRNLSELFQQMVTESGKNGLFHEVDPEIKFNTEFRRVRPEFTRGHMHDAHEYMTWLLELVHQEVNAANRNRVRRPKIQPGMASSEQAWAYHVTFYDNSYLSRLFMWQVESVLVCLTCGLDNRTWNAMWQLEVNLEEEHKAGDDKKILNLMDCINEFTSVETLKDVLCNQCKSRQSHTKQQLFTRPAHYLIVHLKRFSQTGTKIRRAVAIPHELSGLCGQSLVLSNVVCHRGSEDFGHYYTMVREADNKWVQLDDGAVRKNQTNASADDKLQDFAYLCVYKAVKGKEKSDKQAMEKIMVKSN